MKKAKLLLLVLPILVFFISSQALAQDPVSLLPSETVFVMDVNLEKIMSSPYYKQYQKNNPQAKQVEKKLEEFISKTGIDPRKDIKHFTIALKPVEAGTYKESKVGVFAIIDLRKKLSDKKLVDLINEQNKKMGIVPLKEVKMGNYKCYIGKSKKGDEVAFTLMNNETRVYFGHVDYVNSALNVLKSGKAAFVNKGSIKDNVNMLKNKHMIWGIAEIPANFKATLAAKANPMVQPLLAINNLMFSVDFTKELQLKLYGVCKQKAEAESIVNTLMGLLMSIKVMASKNPDAARLLNSLNLTTEHNAAVLSFSMPLDELKQLINKAKSMRPRGGLPFPGPQAPALPVGLPK